LPSQPDAQAEFTNEVVLAGGLRLGLRCAQLPRGPWTTLPRILARVLSVVGKPCFNRLETLFHVLLMEVIFFGYCFFSGFFKNYF
jgi:hypothetical protein